MDERALADAEAAAQAFSATRAPGQTSEACPLIIQRHALAVTVVGEDGLGLEGVAVVLRRGEEKALPGRTQVSGRWVFKGLEPGVYELHLPELDEQAWEVLSDKPLPHDPANDGPDAAWLPWQEPPPVAGFDHAVSQGECAATVAHRNGFFPQTVWEHPRNAALKALRKDMYVLAPGDVVHVPARHPAGRSQATDTERVIRRRGVPERLRIRFLRVDESPRAGVPFVLSITSPSASAWPDLAGKTDAEGFVDAPIPTDATFARILLQENGGPEEHEFWLSALDPVESVTGWQDRLRNLGYSCGDESGEIGPDTEQAIRTFQARHGLVENGAMDARTQARLKALSLS